MPGFKPNNGFERTNPREDAVIRPEFGPAKTPKKVFVEAAKVLEGPQRLASAKGEWNDPKLPTWNCENCHAVGNPDKNILKNKDGSIRAIVRNESCLNCDAPRSTTQARSA